MGLFDVFKKNDDFDEVSEYQRNQDYTSSNHFKMTIEDLFTITGRGTVATGLILSGSINIGDIVKIEGYEDIEPLKVSGIEVFRKKMNKANAGDNIGIILKNAAGISLRRGMVLYK